MQIYIHNGNQQQGPFTIEQINENLRQGVLSADSVLAWYAGCSDWIPLSDVPEVTLPFSPDEQPAPELTDMSEPLARWSLRLSVLSIICCGPVLSIIAVICGHRALSNIKKNPHLRGKGCAIAGLIIGYTVFVLYLIIFSSNYEARSWRY